MVLNEGTLASIATSIVVSGSDVFVAGYGAISGNAHDFAIYWKDGSPVFLTDGTQEAVAESIFVDGSDVYVAGWDGGVAEYWKNGVAVPLNVFDGTNGAEAWSIVVSEGDVYVAGWEYITTQISPTETYTTPVAMLWTNGVPTELSDPLAFGIAHSIFLSGGDIYVAGNTCQENQGPGCDLVTYWKNGTPVVLPGQSPSGEHRFLSPEKTSMLPVITATVPVMTTLATCGKMARLLRSRLCHQLPIRLLSGEATSMLRVPIRTAWDKTWPGISKMAFLHPSPTARTSRPASP